jgi:hypothetical protein
MDGELRCFWCDKKFERLTDDHIVPQSLGGTLEFSVRSCEQCQTRLSKAEREVARKSTLAIHALSSPIRPRHPDRPTSGQLQPLFLLVKNPLGGYGESQLSAGETMRSLAYIEAKVVPGEPIDARIRGATAADAQLLLVLLRKALQLDRKLIPGELVCELTASLEIDPEVAADPEFWPRVILLPGNRLMFRARNPEELVRCARVLEFIARSNYQIDPSKWATDVRITGGTPHKMGLRFDPQCVRRVAAKIAYALFRAITKQRMQPCEDDQMRSYIRARCGQGLFKQRVMRIERKCRITGVENLTHLIASHCKPWRDASNEERLDGENGLLLTPSVDHLFDRGFIGFENSGELIISPIAHRPSLQKMGIETEHRVNVGHFTEGQKHFLEFHRNSVLLRANR